MVTDMGSSTCSGEVERVNLLSCVSSGKNQHRHTRRVICLWSFVRCDNVRVNDYLINILNCIIHVNCCINTYVCIIHHNRQVISPRLHISSSPLCSLPSSSRTPPGWRSLPGTSEARTLGAETLAEKPWESWESWRGTPRRVSFWWFGRSDDAVWVELIAWATFAPHRWRSSHKREAQWHRFFKHILRVGHGSFHPGHP